MWTWVVAGALSGVAWLPGAAVAVPALGAEADLAFHGTAVMNGDRVEVKLTPRNNGPAAVADGTVRLRWSAALAEEQQWPARCAREDERTVVCGTGALTANAVGEQLDVPVRLRDRPSEVTLQIETVWGGGTTDKDHSNDQLKVLVLDTGDAYAF
ncbi:hypothetical protein AB0L59_08485 [Streptomyces sp. NPDC052109]|uniref:hypothetical protein n=1 Tax=Streptomyces sp. NPDC052109 TaxID=3155527 RepID=UPI00343E6D22